MHICQQTTIDVYVYRAMRKIQCFTHVRYAYVWVDFTCLTSMSVPLLKNIFLRHCMHIAVKHYVTIVSLSGLNLKACAHLAPALNMTLCTCIMIMMFLLSAHSPSGVGYIMGYKVQCIRS